MLVLDPLTHPLLNTPFNAISAMSLRNCSPWMSSR